ncbi:hypothetical protein J2S03_003216 [Alicyclobacillus cycloheptanicus]|uniref:Nucleotidyltransferase family protein n=1 Tax=Alicyclobacillus cycloheptanicus TaxID=1457 RepID=A0ABT9XMI9_9BACL|nr:hypothetical protein [Alicyclobacillus cycloheptanicus]
MIPSSSLERITAQLSTCGIDVVLGGSGLLYALGLATVVNDWDLTTDAPLESVAACLKGFHVVRKCRASAVFCSNYILTLPDEGVEIIGGYAIRCGDNVCKLPSISGGTWRSIPIASAEVWAAAYHLMGRLEKSELLFGYLSRVGATKRVVDLLLKQPLPEELLYRLEAMPSW